MGVMAILRPSTVTMAQPDRLEYQRALRLAPPQQAGGNRTEPIRNVALFRSNVVARDQAALP